jgi:hypothetical protein
MPERAQVLNHLLKQAPADADPLVFRQERKNNDFASSSVSEAVPSQQAFCATDVAGQNAGGNVCAPTGSRDAKFAQPGLRNGVLARTASKRNTLRGVTADRRT